MNEFLTIKSSQLDYFDNLNWTKDNGYALIKFNYSDCNCALYDYNRSTDYRYTTNPYFFQGP